MRLDVLWDMVAGLGVPHGGPSVGCLTCSCSCLVAASNINNEEFTSPLIIDCCGLVTDDV